MKSVVFTLYFTLLFSFTQAQESLNKFNTEMQRIESLTDEKEKSNARGIALATLFDTRVAEVGKQSAINEVVPHLRKFLDYDFLGAVRFLLKIKDVEDAKMFAQNYFSQSEQAIFKSVSASMVNNYNNSTTNDYASNVPKNGYGVKGKWNSASSTHTLTTTSGDNGNSELHKGHDAYQRKLYNVALNWYKLAANKGNHEGMMSIASMYYIGDGIEKNETEAFKWYQLAANYGNETAKSMLNLYRNLQNTANQQLLDNGEEELKKGIAAAEAKNYTEALKWYRLAANKENTVAMHNIGAMYYNGEGIDFDDVEAIKWFQKAADKGFEPSKKTLAAVQKDINEGINDFEKAGIAFDKNDYETALKYYKSSADKGYSEAMFQVGSMYYYGDGVAQSNQEALKWFQKAADKGNTNAYILMGTIYIVLNQLEDAFKVYKKAADKDVDMAMHMVGLLYLDGKGVAQNTAEAKIWFRKAADKGYEKSKSILQEIENE